VLSFGIGIVQSGLSLEGNPDPTSWTFRTCTRGVGNESSQKLP
jgi:hypothetical protein